MSVKELNRYCPICKSSNGIILHNQSFVLPENSPLPDNYDIASCTNCGFVFADTSALQDDYNSYYSILSKYEDTSISSGSGFNQNDHFRMIRTAEAIEKFVKKNDSILDLGCANGGQLNVLKEKGFSNLTGVDPSIVCVNNVKALGIEAFHAHIFEKSFIEWDKKFDLIILSHVLEHIRDLEKAIQIAKCKLSEKGIIYIEVPDASRYDKHFVVPYYFIDCEHINHFSSTSLNNLLLQFGFENIQTVHGTIKLNDNVDYPIFYSLFKVGNITNGSLKFDQTTINSFNEFLTQSKTHNNTDIIIQKLVSTQEEVIIWGAGQYALRLLASGNLAKANVIGFVDNDKTKQNKKIGKIEVFAPEFIKNRKSTLLICSALYANNIINAALHLNKNIKYIVLN